MSVISYFSKHYKQSKLIYIKVEHTAAAMASLKLVSLNASY